MGKINIFNMIKILEILFTLPQDKAFPEGTFNIYQALYIYYTEGMRLC